MDEATFLEQYADTRLLTWWHAAVSIEVKMQPL